MSPPSAEQVTQALDGVQDPEIHRPITELGMVKNVSVGADGAVLVEVYLTVAGCPLRDTITRDVTGEEYYSTIYAVQESRLEKGVIWVGANDGPVSVTRDAGRTWQRVTPKDLGPGGRVQTVEPSPIRRGKAYVAILRYQLGDWRPHAYRTTDEEVQRLRDLGWTDPQIAEAVYITALFAFFNRVADAFGLEDPGYRQMAGE